MIKIVDKDQAMPFSWGYARHKHDFYDGRNNSITNFFFGKGRDWDSSLTMHLYHSRTYRYLEDSDRIFSDEDTNLNVALKIALGDTEFQRIKRAVESSPLPARKYR